VGRGIVVAQALPVIAEAGVELRLPALWYVEFVLLRFQDYRDEYPSAAAAGNVGAVAPVPWVETLGSARVTTRMPGRVSSGRRRLCASRTFGRRLQSFLTYENIAKIPIQCAAANRPVPSVEARSSAMTAPISTSRMGAQQWK
jgi:hypothetical protein